jgi:phage shock protein A
VGAAFQPRIILTPVGTITNKETDMGISTRIIQIFKADIHGVMDQLEDPGLLLKQYLREMAEALNHKETELARKIALRNRVRKDHDKYHQQYQTLDNDLTVAVQRGTDNLARRLIRKTRPLESLCEELAGQVAILDEETSQLKSHLSELRLRYEQLKTRSAEFFHRTEMKQRETDTLDFFPEKFPGELSEDDIELELLKRKERLASN